MSEKRLWLKRMVLGGIWAVVIMLALTLLLNVFLNSIIWGGKLYYYSIQLTFDRCAAYFGSAALAVTIEYLSVFVLGAAIGLTTLPFAETWTSLQGLSLLHFVLTGLLAQAVGWSYQWFGFAPDSGPWLILFLYLIVYVLIWGIRWLIWYIELRKMRRALGLKQGHRGMMLSTKFRLTSLVMFCIAVIFVICAMSCPTCGSVFYIGSIRIGSEVWRTFYAIYAIVMALLFIVSFFVRKKK